MAELDPSILLLVDSLNKGFRWKHSGQLVFADEYVNTIKSYQQSYRAGKVVIAADSGSSSYRKEIYPDYKIGRKEKRELQTEQEAKEFELFFKEYLVTLDKFRNETNFPVFRFDKTEADDICAFITKYRKKYGIKKIILLSTDRDYDLLIDIDVMRFSYVTRKETTLENWSSHYNCTPEEYISLKVLQGDAGDSIPGITKVGPVTAKKLIDQYGSAYDVADAIPIPGKLVYIKNINEFGKDNIFRNYQLMDLISYCDEALGIENCKIIDEKMKEYMNVN